MKNKGFTLIEILASIVILGIVLMVGVVSVSRYVENSRQETYISQANKYIDNLIAKVTRRDYSFRQTDTTYYVPVTCIMDEQKIKTTFNSTISSAYVVVTNDGNNLEYYYTQLDQDKRGIRLTYRKSLDKKRIVTPYPSIDLFLGVGNRPYIARYAENCSSTVTNSSALRFIKDKGML